MCAPNRMTWKSRRARKASEELAPVCNTIRRHASVIGCHREKTRAGFGADVEDVQRADDGAEIVMDGLPATTKYTRIMPKEGGFGRDVNLALPCRPLYGQRGHCEFPIIVETIVGAHRRTFVMGRKSVIHSHRPSNF